MSQSARSSELILSPYPLGEGSLRTSCLKSVILEYGSHTELSSRDSRNGELGSVKVR